MNLLVSDYDGTFHVDKSDYLLAKNICSIKRYMDSNNLFAFATGRNFNSIKKQTVCFDIPYDYLICSDGACVFDKNDELINVIKPDMYIFKKVIEYLEHTPYVTKIELVDCYGNITTNLNDAIQIAYTISFDKIKEMKQLNFNNFIKYNMLNNFIIRDNVSKKDGVEFIRLKENIDKENVYTIGDEINDIEMLKEYNGYRVFLSNPKLANEQIPVSSVKKLSMKIRGQK